MMTRSAKIEELSKEFKKELGDIYLLLRDGTVDPAHKAKMRVRLGELENVLLNELDEVKGNTEIRRRDLRAEIERETRQRRLEEGGAR